ncbi:MAG: DUF3108 domain-containing protein [Terriglobales bacterium]
MRPTSIFAGMLFFLALALLAGQLAARPAAQGAAIGPVAQIHPPPDSYVFPGGQAFVYDAEWRLWNAGTARISLDQVGGNGRVFATAESSGFVNVLYPVHDRFQSSFDRRTFCSLSLTKHSEEGFRARETLIAFNYAQHKSILDETNLKNGEKKHVDNDIPGCVTDVLSGIFYVGSQPLTPDAVYTFPLNDGGNTVEVRARVEGREQVKTPAGSFATVRVAPEALSGPLKSKGRIWIWYTDDARHIPVQMRARMFWGTLTFHLVRIEKK